MPGPREAIRRWARRKRRPLPPFWWPECPMSVDRVPQSRRRTELVGAHITKVAFLALILRPAELEVSVMSLTVRPMRAEIARGDDEAAPGAPNVTLQSEEMRIR